MSYKIAICGTFDVENYGDVLFPTILELALKKRGIDFESYLFSPVGAKNKPLDTKPETVYCCDDFEKLDSEVHFDAVVIGGGAILHYEKISVKLPDTSNYTDYYTIKTWLPIISYASARGIKTIINAPQAPFGFPDSAKKLTASIFSACDYLAVRDDDSAEKIKGCFDNNSFSVKVVPDSVCAIASYYNKADLSKHAKAILKLKEGEAYAVFHISRFLPNEAFSTLARAVSLLEDSGLRPVFLPLGPCHGDRPFMLKAKIKLKKNIIIPPKDININDMTAILAGCTIYCGTSFHGSVVSLAFGNKATGFNYYTPTQKTVELYKQLEISNYLSENYKQLIPNLKALLNGKKFRPKTTELNKRVEEHFDAIAKTITEQGNHKKSTTINRNIFELLADFSAVENKSKQLENEYAIMTNKYKKTLVDKNRLLEASRRQTIDEAVSFERKYEEIDRSRIWKKMLAPIYFGSQKITKKFRH